MSERLSRGRRPIAGVLASVALGGVITAGCEAQPTHKDVQRCSDVVGTLSYEKTAFDVGAYFWDGTVRLMWEAHKLIGLEDGRAIKFNNVNDYIKYDVGSDYCETVSVPIEATSPSPQTSVSPTDVCDTVKSAESFKEQVTDPAAFMMTGAILQGVDVKFVLGTMQHGKYIVTDEEFVTHPEGSKFCFPVNRPKSLKA